MVGIVLVSHSHRIAEGAAELARQMGGEDARIETAGGLDTPDHEIGTDAILVQQAIERAWSDDGVLVLMDLGSAVLSAEMAVDLLPEDVDRSKIRLIDAPFVEGAVAAAVTARIGCDARRGRGGGARRAGVQDRAPRRRGPATRDGGPDAAPTAARRCRSSSSSASSTGSTLGRRRRSCGRRPPSTRTCGSATSRPSGARSRARSLNAVATLGVRRGQPDPRHGLRRSGERGDRRRASARAARLRRGARAGPLAELSGADPRRRRRSSERAAGSTGSRPHLGSRSDPRCGSTRRRSRSRRAPPATPPTSDARSSRRSSKPRRTSSGSDRRSPRGPARTTPRSSRRTCCWSATTRSPIRRGRRSRRARRAALAWQRAVEDMAERWEAIDDPYQRARAADVRSVGTQVLARILGIEPPRPGWSARGCSSPPISRRQTPPPSIRPWRSASRSRSAARPRTPRSSPARSASRRSWASATGCSRWPKARGSRSTATTARSSSTRRPRSRCASRPGDARARVRDARRAPRGPLAGGDARRPGRGGRREHRHPGGRRSRARGGLRRRRTVPHRVPLPRAADAARTRTNRRRPTERRRSRWPGGRC